MPSFDNTETVATFKVNGGTYEIDHLGICTPNNYGSYAIYRDGRMLADFCHHAPWENPRSIPLPSKRELIALAKEVLTQ